MIIFGVQHTCGLVQLQSGRHSTCNRACAMLTCYVASCSASQQIGSPEACALHNHAHVGRQQEAGPQCLNEIFTGAHLPESSCKNT